jgi:zinc protease
MHNSVAASRKSQSTRWMQVEIIAKDNALGSAIFTGFPMDITRASDDFAALMVAIHGWGEHRNPILTCTENT